MRNEHVVLSTNKSNNNKKQSTLLLILRNFYSQCSASVGCRLSHNAATIATPHAHYAQSKQHCAVSYRRATVPALPESALCCWLVLYRAGTLTLRVSKTSKSVEGETGKPIKHRHQMENRGFGVFAQHPASKPRPKRVQKRCFIAKGLQMEWILLTPLGAIFTQHKELQCDAGKILQNHAAKGHER